MNNTKTYSKTSIALHWIVGLAFIGVFIIGAYLSDLPRGPEKMELVALHKSFGVLILLIALARVFWRIKEGAIPPASVMPAWQEKVAKAVHGLLLLATLAMPLSGIAMNIGGGRALEVFGYTLVAAGEKWFGCKSLAQPFTKLRLPLLSLSCCCTSRRCLSII